MPFDPQARGWLSIKKAAILLSRPAGRAIADQVIGGEHAFIEAWEIEFVQSPSDGGNGADDTREDRDVTKTEEACVGDLNGDGQVNGADLGLIFGA